MENRIICKNCLSLTVLKENGYYCINCNKLVLNCFCIQISKEHINPEGQAIPRKDFGV